MNTLGKRKKSIPKPWYLGEVRVSFMLWLIYPKKRAHGMHG